MTAPTRAAGPTAVPGLRKVAALYDIHGNLPALEAVLTAVDAAGADDIVLGGDLVLGPMPRETLGRLLALSGRVHCLRGNCDRLVVEAFDGRPAAGLPPGVRDALDWTAGQLDRAHRDTPAERVRPMLAGVTQRVVVCGHTHMAFDRTVDGVRLVDAGSVGMPYGRPGAYWLRLGPEVHPIRTEYDLERAAARVRRTGCPQASEFAARHVLSPESESAMLRAFEPTAMS